MSLLSSISAMVTPMIVDRIASALGINSALARTAINVALPAILGAFATKAATPSGAAALQNAVTNANPNIFGSLDSILSGSNKDSFMSSSSSALNGLLGGSAVSQLANTIGSKAGIGGAAASALVPLVSQLALSGIAKTAGNTDASGLARMLASDTNGYNTTASTPTYTPSKPQQGGMPSWLMWAIPAIIIAGGLWYFLSGPSTTTPPAPEATQTQPAPETPPADQSAGINIDGVDVTKSINDVVGGLTTTLGTVTDATTAQAALPKLQELGATADKVAGVAAKFTPEQKTAVGGLLATALPAAKAAAEKALAANGVGDVLKPVVDGLFAKLEGLAK
jgi:hypothetical protein